MTAQGQWTKPLAQQTSEKWSKCTQPPPENRKRVWRKNGTAIGKSVEAPHAQSHTCSDELFGQMVQFKFGRLLSEHNDHWPLIHPQLWCQYVGL